MGECPPDLRRHVARVGPASRIVPSGSSWKRRRDTGLRRKTVQYPYRIEGVSLVIVALYRDWCSSILRTPAVKLLLFTQPRPQLD